jgi:hypothetical protein
MKFSPEFKPNIQKTEESRVENPTESKKILKNLIKTGVFSVASAFATNAQSQNKSIETKSYDVSVKHEYTLPEVKDFVTFKKIMDKDNQYDPSFNISKEQFFKAEQERLLLIFQQYEKQRQWLFKIVNSPEYMARLEKEYNGHIPESVLKDIENIKNDSNFVVKDAEVASENVLAYYSPETKNVHFSAPGNYKEIKTTAVHEFAHESKDLELSPYAKGLYTIASTDTNFTKEEKEKDSIYRKENGHSYFLNPIELDARKKEFEYEMEQLGVKKYGDTFTKEHYDQIIKLRGEGKFLDGTDQFIRMIKPEYFIEIMNGIAKNDIEDNDIIERTG